MFYIQTGPENMENTSKPQIITQSTTAAPEVNYWTQEATLGALETRYPQ